MNEKQQKILNSIVVLSAICAVAALLLGVVNHITAPVIARNLAEKEKESLSFILKDAKVGEKMVIEGYPGVEVLFPVFNENEEVNGVVLKLKGEGYGGSIFILSYFDLKGNLIDASITQHSETSGIGSKAAEPGYMNKFIGKGGGEPLPLIKSDLSQEQADAVSGASITFEAVSAILERGSKYVKEKGIQ